MAMVWPWRARGYARLRTRRHRAAERDELLEGSEKVPRRFLGAIARQRGSSSAARAEARPPSSPAPPPPADCRAASQYSAASAAHTSRPSVNSRLAPSAPPATAAASSPDGAGRSAEARKDDWVPPTAGVCGGPLAAAADATVPGVDAEPPLPPPSCGVAVCRYAEKSARPRASRSARLLEVSGVAAAGVEAISGERGPAPRA